MGYIGAKGITWKELEAANLIRIPQFKNARGELAHSHPTGQDWSPAQWYQAMMGEFGEYANIRKKFERGDISKEEFKQKAGYELADGIIYLSILAYQLGINIDDAIVEKFNIVSERVEADIFIHPVDFEWYRK